MITKLFWSGWSIARLTLFMVLAPLLCASLVLSYYQINGRLQEMTEILQIEGGIIAEHIAHDTSDYLLAADIEKSQRILEEIVKQSGVTFAQILDKDKNVFASYGKVPAETSGVKGLEIARPIISKKLLAVGGVKEGDATVGWVYLVMSAQVIEDKKSSVLTNSLIVLMLGLIISTIVAVLISRRLYAPFKKLHAAVESISAGNFNTKLSLGQSGEFGEIESGINKMAKQLRLSAAQQKQKIDEATQALMELVLQLEQKNVLLDEARKEAEEIGNSKVEFLANMSHEIRTPLNAVIGASDLLAKIVSDVEAEKYMSTLSVASRQLNSVVDDILDFSRLEANKLELEHVTFNIIEVLEGVISLHAPVANKKSLELILHIDSDMPDVLIGDPMRIAQVVGNLVSNAIKFTDSGRVVVSAGSMVMNNVNIRLQIKVKDTGAGLTDSVHKKLFDAFSQADTATARKYGGSGLGLAIVSKLVEQMQGFINVQSKLGEGTEFTVHLDVALAGRAKAVVEQSLASMSVLLYQPESGNDLDFEKSLVAWDVETTLCLSDDDFIGHLMKNKTADIRCDCIVLAVEPGVLSINSIEEAVTKIRHLSAVPIIVLMHASEFSLPSNIDDEQVFCLTQPVSEQRLYARLNAIKNNVTSRDLAKNISSTFKALKILIAEDNAFNRDLLTDMLLAFGAEVASVEDGQMAVTAALRGNYDIIFLDLHMPRKDGITAANEIRNAALDKSPLLIAATADVFIKEQGEDVDVFDSFVFKPIREEVLLEKIATLLNFQGEYQQQALSEEKHDSAFSEKLDREVRKLVLHIVEASNNNDYDEIKNYSHQLRGVCGFYELTEWAEVASNLEKAAKDERREDVVSLIKVLLKKLNISPDYKTIH